MGTILLQLMQHYLYTWGYILHKLFLQKDNEYFLWRWFVQTFYDLDIFRIGVAGMGPENKQVIMPEKNSRMLMGILCWLLTTLIICYIFLLITA